MPIPTLKSRSNPMSYPVPIPPPTDSVVKMPSPPLPPVSVSSSTSSISPLPSMTLPCEVFGTPIVEKLLSKSFGSREQSLHSILNFLRHFHETYLKHSPTKTLIATQMLLERALQDKVFTVYSLAIDIVLFTFLKFININRVEDYELLHCAKIISGSLLCRIGDSNPRIKTATILCIPELCRNPRLHQNDTLSSNLVFKQFDSDLNANQADGRCSLVEKIIQRFHIYNTPWMTLPSLMKFALKALDHSSVPVRESGERIILALYIQVGDAILPFLPESRDKSPYKHLLEEMEKLNEQAKTGGNPEISRYLLPNEAALGLEFDEDPELKSFCIFCKRRSMDIAQVGLETHFLRDCPMLTSCKHCKMVVEISNLTEHLLGECDNRHKMRQCPRCLEAIVGHRFPEHLQSRSCLPANLEYMANRCPLCHNDIPPGDEGWRTHHLNSPGCPANTRIKVQSELKRVQFHSGQKPRSRR